MRSIVVYAIAVLTIVVGLWFVFPTWFGTTTAQTGTNSRPNRMTPVVVATAVSAPFADRLEAFGTIFANESVRITPNRADHVTAIHFDDGQHVDAGDLLLEMNATEERAQLAAALASQAQAKTDYGRALELRDERLVSERELDTAQTNLAESNARVAALEAAIDDRQVRAPFSGLLGIRRVSVGAFVQPSDVITTLDDLSIVNLDFTIPETWLSAVQPGMKIEAHSVAWPGKPFEGQITTIDTRLDAQTRSVTIRAKIRNADGLLRPGMLLEVQVERGEAPVLQIPEEAIVPIGPDHFVWRVDGTNVVHRVSVQVGRRSPGRVEITTGLEIGDRVVVEGIVRVRDGETVQVVADRTNDKV